MGKKKGIGEVPPCAGRKKAESAWYRPQPCSRKGTIQEDGQWWCHQHAPSSEKARYDKSEADWQKRLVRQRHARIKSEWDNVIEVIQEIEERDNLGSELSDKLREMYPKVEMRILAGGGQP